MEDLVLVCAIGVIPGFGVVVANDHGTHAVRVVGPLSTRHLRHLGVVKEVLDVDHTLVVDARDGTGSF
jgi:hypothetical protein